MFAQFQARYPTGCLISELLTIYHGKYVVRVSVQIDGVMRATGMAVADTIEVAEDQARIRALEIIDIQSSATTSTQPVTAEFPKHPVFSQERSELANTDSISTDTSWLSETVQPTFPQRTTPTAPSRIGAAPTGSNAPITSNLDWKRDSYVESPEIPSSINEVEQTVNYSKVTPIGSRFQDREISAVQSDRVDSEPIDSVAEKTDLQDPIDLSEAIARIPIEMSRAGWTTEEGRDYLWRTFKKRSRSQLSPEQVMQFYNHLKSLPNATP